MPIRRAKSIDPFGIGGAPDDADSHLGLLNVLIVYMRRGESVVGVLFG
jgi:hypothetical protein